MKQIISILIILSLGVMSCKKENTENRPDTIATFDTTGYFRFSDSATGHYCFSRVKASSNPGLIDVIIKSGVDSLNAIIFYNMPQLGGGTFYFEDYDHYQYHFRYLYADAWINGHRYKSKLGGYLIKTGLFSFTFSLKFDNLTHTLTGYGSY